MERGGASVGDRYAMTIARIAVLLAGTALVTACAADSKAPNALTSAAPAAAVTPARVDNFQLVDQNLVAHELFRYADAPAVVLVAQQLGDKAAGPQADKLAADYAAK